MQLRHSRATYSKRILVLHSSSYRGKASRLRNQTCQGTQICAEPARIASIASNVREIVFDDVVQI